MEYEIYKRFIKKLHQGAYAESIALGNTLAELIAAGNRNHGEFYARLLYNLGGLNFMLNRNTEAVSRYREASAEYEAFSNCLMERSNAQNNLGIALSLAGFYDESAESFQKSLSVRTAFLGETHALTAHTWYNLGNAYLEAKNYPAARKCMNTALKCEAFEKNDKIDALFSLAIISEAEDDMKSAIDIFSKTLSFQKQSFGENSSGYIANLSYLASMCAKNGDYGQAAKKCAKAAGILTKICPSHPNLVALYEKLSEYYVNMGQTEKAITALEKSITYFRKLYGEHHITLAVTLNSLAALYRGKDSGKSLKLMRRALKVTEKVTGTASLPYIREVLSICLLYFEEGLPGEVIDKLIRETVRKINKSVKAEASPARDLNQMVETLTAFLGVMDKAESIKPSLITILELLRKMHGDDNAFQ